MVRFIRFAFLACTAVALLLGTGCKSDCQKFSEHSIALAEKEKLPEEQVTGMKSKEGRDRLIKDCESADPKTIKCALDATTLEAIAACTLKKDAD